MKKKLLLYLAGFTLMAAAATITNLSSLPDGAGVFTQANHDQVNTNVTSANTDFANVNTQLNTATTNISSASGAIATNTAGIASASGAIAGMIPASTFADCATTAACPSTAQTAIHVVEGRGTLATGSPSTDAITTISPAFSSSTSYACYAQDTTTIANNVGVLTAGYVSGSAVTFTGPNTNTDTFRFTCVGY